MSTDRPPVPIAFCITDLDSGGAERVMVQIVTRLDRTRWQPAVYCLSQRGVLADELEVAGIPVTCLGMRGWGSWLGIYRLANHLRKNRPAILQTFLYHANLVGRLAGLLARVPKIVSGIRVAEKRSRFRLKIDRWTERLIDKHVCVSHDVANFSVNEGGLTSEKIVTIPNGVDFDDFANALPADLTSIGIPSDSRVIVSVGRLDVQKNPKALLEAFRHTAEKFPDVHLLFIGDGNLRSVLEERVLELHLQHRVYFTGRVDDVAPFLRAADCFALASRWEGMPNAVLEAMASGLPCVCTDAEGVRELIEDGRTGIVVPQESPEVMQNALNEIFTYPERSQKLANTAQVVSSKYYTWQSIIEKYDHLYRELLADSHEFLE